MQRSKQQWCAESIDTVIHELGTNLKEGLKPKEVDKRRARYGFNILTTTEEAGILLKTLRQFKDPLVAILLFAAVATIFLDEMIDFIVIAIALLINVSIGVFQEERASRAFEKLNSSQEKFATVLRNGKKSQISAEKLVPGDIVIIEAGSHVPADVRLFEAKNLGINEAALTGEWMEVHKHIGEVHDKLRITEQFNMAWMGTLVTTGYGRGVVVSIGAETEVGKIAEHLGATDTRETPLQQNISRVARFLVVMITLAIGVIFLLGVFRGESTTDMILISIAIAVAAMPQGLPAAVTVVLALGMESILRQGGLVRSLLAAETLGATTIVLTDKTGTLTEARMKLVEHIVASERTGQSAVSNRDEEQLLTSAILASDAFVEHNDEGVLIPQGRPIERAIVAEGLERGLSQDVLKAGERRLDLLKFESARRYAVSLNAAPARGESDNRMYISGAPELLLKQAAFVLDGGVVRAITEEDRAFFAQEQQRKSEQGMRLIGVGYIKTAREKIPEDFVLPEHDLILVGFLVFNDPIRIDTKEAIAEVQSAGVRVIMLTGDNPGTARNIAEQVGIRGAEGGALTGADIEAMEDPELLEALSRYSVIARVLPEQKLRIARLLKNEHEVVAMTGDGINDAPALRSADIGVAVGGGTEVAKEASDIVLLNNSFSIIVSAIRIGRRIVDNLKKIIAYLLSTSFSGLTVIAASLITGTPLPILPTQILWANIVEEGFMSFAFAFEPEEEDVMQRDPRSNQSKHILTGELKKLILISASITGGFLIILYFWLLSIGLPIEEIRTIMFVSLTLDSIFFAFSLKNLRKPVWRINFLDNKYLLIALTISTLLLFAALTVPALKTLLSLTSLHPWEVALLAGVGLFNLFVIEIFKYLFFRRKPQAVQNA